MLSLLLDENISPEVARQVTEKRPDIVVMDIGRWQGGRFLAAQDTAILTAAAREGRIRTAHKCSGEYVCAECEKQYMQAVNKWVHGEQQGAAANPKKRKDKPRHGITENTPAKGRVRLFRLK